jgi:hypothetical protein
LAPLLLLLLLLSCCCCCDLLELLFLLGFLPEDAGVAVLLFEIGILLGVLNPAELGRVAAGFSVVMCWGVRGRPLLSVLSCSSKVAAAADAPAGKAEGTSAKHYSPKLLRNKPCKVLRNATCNRQALHRAQASKYNQHAHSCALQPDTAKTQQNNNIHYDISHLLLLLLLQTAAHTVTSSHTATVRCYAPANMTQLYHIPPAATIGCCSYSAM